MPQAMNPQFLDLADAGAWRQHAYDRGRWRRGAPAVPFCSPGGSEASESPICWFWSAVLLRRAGIWEARGGGGGRDRGQPARDG